MESEVRKDPALLPSQPRKAAYDKGLYKSLHTTAAGHTRYKTSFRSRSGILGEIQASIPDI